MTNNKLRRFGESRDKNDRLVGRYLFFQHKEQQQELDKFFEQFLKTAQSNSDFFITLDLETTGLVPYKNEIILVSISWNNKESIVFIPANFDLTLFKEVLSQVKINNHNIKFDGWVLLEKYGVLIEPHFDVMLATQVGWCGVFPQSSYSLENISKQLLQGLALNKGVRNDFIDMPYEIHDEHTEWIGLEDRHISYSAQDTMVTHRLVEPIVCRLVQTGLLNLWENIEKPLLKLFTKFQYEGVAVNYDLIQEMYLKYEKDTKTLLDEMQDRVAGISENVKKAVFKKGIFNPNSTPQILAVLNDVGIRLKNTTEESLLEAAANNPHPLLIGILEYRSLLTYLSKYLKPWLTKDVNHKTKRIHPVIWIIASRGQTGRLSASDPPVMGLKKDLRPFIIADEGCTLVIQDHSQFELRAAAGFSNETNLLRIFDERKSLIDSVYNLAQRFNERDPDTFSKLVLSDENIRKSLSPQEIELVNTFSHTDVHKRTASLIFNKPVEKVDSKDRSTAKCVGLNTYLYTEKGLCQIKDLLPNKLKTDTFYKLKKPIKVYTDTGISEATQVYFGGKQPCYEITTASGNKITCTGKHSFRIVGSLGDYSWTETSNLKVGQEVIIKTSCKKPPSFSTNESLRALILAFSKKDILVPKNKKQFDTIVEFLVDAGIKHKILDDKVSIKILSKDLDNQITDGVILSYLNWVQIGCVDRNRILLNLDRNLLDNCRNICRFYDLPYKIVDNSLVVKEPKSGKYLENYYRSLPKEFFHKAISRIEKNVKNNSKISLLEREQDTDLPNFRKDILVNLEDHEIRLVDFLNENNLRKDLIVSIKFLGDVEVADISVPQGNTYIAEGFVTHNTINYAILYGATDIRLQQSLAKDGVFLGLKGCKDLHDKYFESLPNLARYIQKIKNQVHDPGFIETPLGRKKFFELPPKYLGSYYNKKKEDAYREAVNAAQQSANADAIKKAIITLNERFQEYGDPRLKVLFPIHDELIIQVPNDPILIQEISQLMKSIMTACGEESVNYTVPIECSMKISPYWS
jgi:DNA polymerase I-like protein with 3'-5' exonuclease and polymerase domains/intein/homing endonuclease